MSGADAAAKFSGVMPVEDRHRFDEAALARWMEANVGDYTGPLTVQQFKGGQSNPSYRLDTPGQAYVLRRKPFGPLLPSAHAVDREFRVISALYPTGFPVARPYALCEDTGVIGAMFYIMECVDGRVLWDGSLPGLSPDERGANYRSAIDTLARLHQTDHVAAGLETYGKPGNYFARQIERWTRQYRASETQVIAPMDRLIAWLPTTTPEQDRTSVVHGDYRIDNMMFAPTEPRVVAVLDWELSTLGDPLADFSYFLMQWALPSDGRSGLAGLDLPTLGIPSVEAATAQYCELTGRSGLPNLDWYFAYNLFRLVGIVQGIAKRIQEGTAASAQAAEAAARAVPLAERAWSFALKAGA
ncbi:MAG: phosphotransferase family protein [Caulobacteraceae bacterium]